MFNLFGLTDELGAEVKYAHTTLTLKTPRDETRENEPRFFHGLKKLCISASFIIQIQPSGFPQSGPKNSSTLEQTEEHLEIESEKTSTRLVIDLTLESMVRLPHLGGEKNRW